MNGLHTSKIAEYDRRITLQASQLPPSGDEIPNVLGSCAQPCCIDVKPSRLVRWDGGGKRGCNPRSESVGVR